LKKRSATQDYKSDVKRKSRTESRRREGKEREE